MKLRTAAMLTVVVSLLWGASARAEPPADYVATEKLIASMPPVPFYGLYSWASDIKEPQIALIKDVGLGLVGTPLTPEHERGIALCVQSGITICGLIGPNAYINKGMDMDGYRKDVQARAERFGPGGSFWKENADLPARPVIYWCLVSEPGTELKPLGDMMNDEAYYKALEVASEVLRGYSKDLRIIAMTPIGTYSTTLSLDTVNKEAKVMGPHAFIRGVHDRGGSKLYDCIDIHPFTFPLPPDTGGLPKLVQWLKDETRRAGGENGEKPIWFTEIGFPMAYGPGVPFHNTKEQAADYAVRGLVIAARYGVQSITYTYINDQISSRTGWYKGYGLFKGGKLRPAAKAIRLMTHLIPDRPQLLEVISDGENIQPNPAKSSDRPYTDSPFYCYKFKGQGDDQVIVAWTEGRPFKYQMKVSGDKVSLYNREILGGIVYSKANKSISDAGEIRVPITGTPIFVSTRVTPEQEKATELYLKPPTPGEWRPIEGTED